MSEEISIMMAASAESPPKQVNAEPIPGYRLLERLGQGGFGEVWKCEAPGGLFKALKFVRGNAQGLHFDNAQIEKELQAVERIKAIRHPFLLSIDRVEHVDGELLIVTELADKSLHDVWSEYRKGGAPGIPRGQLLSYLQEAAEILDVLNFFFDLQHLDVKPQNLFLVSNHLKIGDFGLVSSLSASAGASDAVTALSPLYGAPERFAGRVSRHSDQYSLAIVYQQMLTGALPFDGKNLHQFILMHSTAAPSLTMLPTADQPVVARALAKEPDQRFPSCKAFLQALASAAAPAALTETQRFSRTAVFSRGQMRSAHTVRAAERAGDKGAPAANGIRDAGERTASMTDTRMQASDKTPPPLQRSSAAKTTSVVPGRTPSQVSPLARCQLLESLESSPLCDVWKARDESSRLCQVRIVYGLAGCTTALRQQAVDRLRSLHHELLPEAEYYEEDFGRLVIRTPLAARTLLDRFRQCQAQHLPGIPRPELLDVLRSVATGLDELARDAGIFHLRLEPRKILLGPARAQVDEFGLTQLIWQPGGQPAARLQGRYSAPEVAKGHGGLAADQYSLAVLYHVLLTGRHAPVARAGQPTALDALPEGDREAVARALHPDPAQRWPSCGAFIEALARAGDTPNGNTALDEFARFVADAAHLPRATRLTTPGTAFAALRQILADAGTAVTEGPSVETARPLLAADGGTLAHQFTTGLSLAAARLKLDVIRQLWQGRLLRDAEGCYEFHLNLPSKFWRITTGRQPGLVAHIELARQQPLAETLVHVRVLIKPYRCGPRRGPRLLERIGLSLLEQLQNALVINSASRVQERVRWPHPLQVQPVFPDGTRGEPVPAQGRDLSQSGVGFYLSHPLPTVDVLIRLPATAHTPEAELPATLVRARRDPGGWFEVGAVFRLAESCQADDAGHA